MPAELKFMFQINDRLEHGKVAVKPMEVSGTWLVMCRTPLSDAQITMAIARFIAKYDPASDGALPSGS